MKFQEDKVIGIQRAQQGDKELEVSDRGHGSASSPTNLGNGLPIQKVWADNKFKRCRSTGYISGVFLLEKDGGEIHQKHLSPVNDIGQNIATKEAPAYKKGMRPSKQIHMVTASTTQDKTAYSLICNNNNIAST